MKDGNKPELNWKAIKISFLVLGWVMVMSMSIFAPRPLGRIPMISELEVIFLTLVTILIFSQIRRLLISRPHLWGDEDLGEDPHGEV